MSKDHQTGTGTQEALKHELGAAHRDQEAPGYPLADPARFLAYLQQLAEAEADS